MSTVNRLMAQSSIIRGVSRIAADSRGRAPVRPAAYTPFYLSMKMANTTTRSNSIGSHVERICGNILRQRAKYFSDGGKNALLDVAHPNTKKIVQKYLSSISPEEKANEIEYLKSLSPKDRRHSLRSMALGIRERARYGSIGKAAKAEEVLKNIEAEAASEGLTLKTINGLLGKTKEYRRQDGTLAIAVEFSQGKLSRITDYFENGRRVEMEHTFSTRTGLGRKYKTYREDGSEMNLKKWNSKGEYVYLRTLDKNGDICETMNDTLLGQLKRYIENRLP